VDLRRARINLRGIDPKSVHEEPFVRAYNTKVKAFFGRKYFFDSEWSYKRGYRFNFKETHPVLYIAADHLVASSEIGPRTRKGLLVPHLQSDVDPYLYLTVRVTAELLDLTTPSARVLLGVTLEEVLTPTERWDDDMEKGKWSITHHVGRLALQDGRFDGILYPSYPAKRLLRLSRKQNVAIFMDPASENMARPLRSSVKLDVVDPGGVLKQLKIDL
jgi:RES domain-containing protein